MMSSKSFFSSLFAKALFTGVLVSFISACLGPIKPAPKTRAEAMSIYMNNSDGYSVKDNYQSKLSFDKTVAKVKKLSNKCLNFETRVTSTGRSTSPTGTWTYTTSVKSLGKSKAELTSRRIDPVGLTPAGHMPKDGYFIMLADISKAKNGLANVNVYAAKYLTDEFQEALKKWVTTSSVDCTIDFDD